MSSYTLNRRAVTHAKELIDRGRVVLDSEWNEAQPSAEDENAYRATHSWKEYAAWHLGLTDGANDETKARHAFVVGDFERIHRSALIACVFRASQFRHKSIELAAHRLLQRLDKATD